jgi:hypothetical protein
MLAVLGDAGRSAKTVRTQDVLDVDACIAMGERRHGDADSFLKVEMTVHRTAVFTLVAAGLIVLGLTGGTAVAQSGGGDPQAKARTTTSVPKARARTRIRVRPSSYDYPGPNAVRQCTAWLAPDYRPSGTVIVPHMQCWWERR